MNRIFNLIILYFFFYYKNHFLYSKQYQRPVLENKNEKIIKLSVFIHNYALFNIIL